MSNFASRLYGWEVEGTKNSTVYKILATMYLKETKNFAVGLTFLQSQQSMMVLSWISLAVTWECDQEILCKQKEF